MTNFADRLSAAVRARGTPAVVGIDPVIERLPAGLQPRDGSVAAAAEALEAFARGVIDAVAPTVPAVKINSAFFEALYAPGVAAYYRLIAHAHQRGLLVIGDVKRGDIGSTARLYARGHLARPAHADFDASCIADAVTVAGYLGESAVRAFVEAAREAGRGLFVLVRPSDPGADEIHEFGQSERLYQHLARLVDRWGSRPELIGDCGLSLVGAVVAPKDAASTSALRVSLPRTPLLVPGFGAQGADAAACRPCFLPDGTGAIVNASRSVIYAHQNSAYTDRFKSDWMACVAQAARDFAADVARLIRPPA